MGRPRRPGERPKCPQHPNGYVVFDGLYGDPDHRRQRYRCWPTGKSGKTEPYHRFTEPLPRQVTVGGVCIACERDVHQHEGPSGPRNYCFTAHDVAEALVAVGKGATYCNAASDVRRRAERFPRDNGSFRYTRHGQLVADFVEVFAPVVFEPYRRFEWPAEDSIVVDHLGFRSRGWDAKGRPKTGPVAFNIFAAQGYEDGRGLIWHLEAFSDASAATWSRFFGRLSGDVERVVTDGHSGTIRAAGQRWPDAVHWRAEWQLKQALKDYITKAKLHGNTKLWERVEAAFYNEHHWEQFKAQAYKHRKKDAAIEDMWQWIEDFEDLVLRQMRNPPRPSKAKGNPRTLGGLEIKLDKLKAWIDPRVHGFRNRERLNRLLMLMQLELNDQADVDAYTRSIREWLLARDGKPVPRRLIVDDYGTTSLISPAAQKFRKVPGSSGA